jgi:general secretion pathway protein D
LARTWIDRLDHPSASEGGQRLYVYPVQNGKAEKLAGLLNDVFSQKPPISRSAAKPSLAPADLRPANIKSAEAKVPAKSPFAASLQAADQDGLMTSQDIRVIADIDNNTLLILSSPSDYERIELTLRKLDVVPRQVLIEVAIAEVTLTDEFKFGLEWYFNNGGRITGKLDAGASGIAQLIPGISYAWTSATGDINAVMNMLAKDSKLNIISSPHITVADNQTAKIQVGDRVPTISQLQSATAVTGVIESVQYIETGVLLSVTPRVNSGGLVTMEISQEVSNASLTTTSNINSPTIQKRSAESTVTVQSGETLVLAGLINENKSKSSDGIPLLSRIPLLGGLFGSQSYTDNRTELIILITPRVLNSVKDAIDITEEYRKRVAGLENLLNNHTARSITRKEREIDQIDQTVKLRMSSPPDFK